LAIGKQQIEKIGQPNLQLFSQPCRTGRLVTLRHRYRYTNHHNVKNIKLKLEQDRAQKEYNSHKDEAKKQRLILNQDLQFQQRQPTTNLQKIHELEGFFNTEYKTINSQTYFN